MAILRFTHPADKEMSPEELSALLTSVMPEIPGYRVMRRIGKGGMSFVYLAVQESLDRQVAIKITAPEILRDEISKQRFEQEARTIAKLEHPCIVGIYEVGRSPQGLMYYVMPYLSKGHLGQRDLRDDEARIIHVLRSLLSALAYAHTRGIVHRDVKAENVLFDNADRPVLADFGIAQSFRSATRITTVGFAVGSAAYMAPEQARGEQVDGRADLYAVGVLAYEMLVGHLPFQGQDALALAVMHAQDPVPTLPNSRRHWQPFVSTALAKKPDQRFRNAEEMLNALEDVERRIGRERTPATTTSAAKATAAFVTGEVPSAAVAVAPPPRIWRWWPWAATAAGLAGLGLAAGLWLLRPSGPPAFVLPAPPAADAPAAPDPIGALVEAVNAAPEPASPVADTPPDASVAVDPGQTAGETAMMAGLAFRSNALPYDPRQPAARELLAAQRQISQRRLSNPPGDNASESLLAARVLAPRDPLLAVTKERLLQAFGKQIDRVSREGNDAAALTLWQRASRFAREAELGDSRAWREQVAAREAAFLQRIEAATAARNAAALAATAAAIDAWGLAPEAFAAALRRGRIAVLPQAGERLAGAGLPMRLVVPPTEARSGWAAMDAEVRRADYAAFAEATGRPPSRCRSALFERRTWASPGFVQSPDDPVVCVTAADAAAYAAWRSRRDGLRYRLPTAAEWTVMAQGAGSDCASTRLACDRREGTVAAGSGRASRLGLKDVGGNVREWLAGGTHTAGAGWRTVPGGARPAATATAGDPRGQDDLGFRLVRDVPVNDLLNAPAR